MSTLKWYNGTAWVTLYEDEITRCFNEIAKCLKIANNLSDVADVQLSRDNLGLSGDNNTTHFHDSHYLPMFQNIENEMAANKLALENEMAANVARIESEISTVSGQITALSNYITSRYYVGYGAPLNPINDQSIWFDLTSRTIKAYSSNKWGAFSGVWLAQ